MDNPRKILALIIIVALYSAFLVAMSVFASYQMFEKNKTQGGIGEDGQQEAVEITEGVGIPADEIEMEEAGLMDSIPEVVDNNSDSVIINNVEDISPAVEVEDGSLESNEDPIVSE